MFHREPGLTATVSTIAENRPSLLSKLLQLVVTRQSVWTRRDLRRTVPICRNFGSSRGKPIDRYYIETFLGACKADIFGTVLEVKDDAYTRRFGVSRVTQSEVIDIKPTSQATIIADLENEPALPAGHFDCIIFTQTLQYIFNFDAAIEALYRALKPGGTLLLTAPGNTPLAQSLFPDTWYWSFTRGSVRRILERRFPRECIDMQIFGNVLAAKALLDGLAFEDVGRADLDICDPDYQVIIAARAEKPAASREL